MKILILTNNFGGLHSFRREVVQAVVDKGYRVSISAPVDFKTHFFEELGCEIIKSLTKQLGGKIIMFNQDKGTAYKLTFPTQMEHTIE